MVYLDNAATTFPKPDTVYSVMNKANREMAINAGRGAYRLAREVGNLISETKEKIRKLVYADISAAVVFTPSITIALNQIIHGISWRDNATIYVSPYEHNAVARPLHYLSKKIRITIKELPINEVSMEIDIDRMRYEFSKDKPDAVFCTHVSNVTGYILPVEDIFAESKKYKSINILDSAQSLGLIPVNSRTLNADFIAFAGHKTLYGPFGIGGFVNITNVDLSEFLAGGTGSDSLNLDMPKNKEARYEMASTNILAVAGLNAALQCIDQEQTFEIEKNLTEYLINSLKSIPEIKMLLPTAKDKHVGIVSFIYQDMKSDDIGMILDEDFDIAVRTGYHCAPYIHKYLKDEKSLGTVRIGLSIFTTKQDIDILVSALKELR